MLTDATADALSEAFSRWSQATAEQHEACPVCRELVIVTPTGEPGAATFGHRHPVCEAWSQAMALMGIELVPQRRAMPRG